MKVSAMKIVTMAMAFLFVMVDGQESSTVSSQESSTPATYPQFFCYYGRCLRSCGTEEVCSTVQTCNTYSECENTVCMKYTNGSDICRNPDKAFNDAEKEGIRKYIQEQIENGKKFIEKVVIGINGHVQERVKEVEGFIADILKKFNIYPGRK
ncbi:hypothetical protein C0J52_18000 [Blattella germanica]|nr:hypothetical protein C0J52_18000 [Blattella germanica]